MLFICSSINNDSRLHLNLPHRKSGFTEKSSAFCTLYGESKKSVLLYLIDDARSNKNQISKKSLK